MAEEEDAGGGIPEWVVTFGDMMSLLLTFFIMLVSMSEIKEEERFQAMVESLRQKFGHEMSSMSMAPGRHKPRNSKLAKLATESRSMRQNTMSGGDKVEATVGENPRVQTLRDAEYVLPKNVVYFARDSSEITDAQKRQLQPVIEQFQGKALKIELRGHAGRRRAFANSSEADDWDEAFARSRAVMEYLVSQGIDRRRFLLVSAGDNEPLYREDPELMQRNPRVELCMLNETWQERDGSPTERQRQFADEVTPDAP